MKSPVTEYSQRIEARRAALAQKLQTSRKLWILRRILMAIIAVMIILAVDGRIRAWWIVLPVAAFIAAMAIHQRVLAEVERLERAVKFYERGLARIEDRWAGTGETGEQFADKLHPYAEDMDLFGKGSLFELLSTARTKSGEEKLAAWLLAPASAEEIRARQAGGPKNCANGSICAKTWRCSARKSARASIPKKLKPGDGQRRFSMPASFARCRLWRR